VVTCVATCGQCESTISQRRAGQSSAGADMYQKLVEKFTSTVELSMSKYPCLPNFSATGHLEPKIVTFNVSSWRPYWNSRWRPIHWSDLLDPTIFELSMSKYLCVQNFTLSAGCEVLSHISAPLIFLQLPHWHRSSESCTQRHAPFWILSHVTV